MMVGASNELPTEAELQALYDRLLLRYEVNPIQSAGAFATMIQGANAAAHTATITREDLRDAQRAVDEIPAGDTVLAGLTEIRKRIIEAGLRASDRRWKKSFRLARARAVVHSREETKVEDLIVLSHTLWDVPEQRRKVERIVATVASPLAAKALDYENMVEEIKNNVLFLSDGTPNPNPDPAQGSEANAKLKVIGSELSALIEKVKADGGDTSALDKALASSRRINRQICEVALGIDVSSVQG
jgi:MoxR-like ATPase